MVGAKSHSSKQITVDQINWGDAITCWGAHIQLPESQILTFYKIFLCILAEEKRHLTASVCRGNPPPFSGDHAAGGKQPALFMG